MKLKHGKKSGLKYFSYADIMSCKPCYDPVQYIPRDWRGTALEILNRKDIPPVDGFWCVFKLELISDRAMRLFAVWCARQVQYLMTDPRSIAALDVAERFANGKASQEELTAAWEAAEHAAWGVARDATLDAVWDAARAARDVTREAALVAAWASSVAARDAARDATPDATWTARDAAWEAAGAAQRDKLMEMIRAEGKERVKPQGEEK